MRDLIQPVLAEIARRRDHHAAEVQRYQNAEQTLAGPLYDELVADGAEPAPEADAEPMPDGDDEPAAAAEDAEEPADKPATPGVERLVCQHCGNSFSRSASTPGAKPSRCPDCRASQQPAAVAEINGTHRKCIRCDALFEPSQPEQRYCSRDCKLNARADKREVKQVGYHADGQA